MATDEVSTLLDSISAQGALLREQKIGAREGLLESARALIAALEHPGEAVRRLTAVEPACYAAVRTAIDLRLFEHLGAAGPDGTSTAQLAKAVGADEVLIQRLLRHLNATHVVREVGADAYAPGRLSEALREARFADGVVMIHDSCQQSFQRLPGYLQRTGYADPRDPAAGPFQAAHDTALAFWPWLEAHPPLGQVFNSGMTGFRATERTWLDPGGYPIAERLLGGTGSRDDEVLLVDVGGGLGQDCEAVRRKHPELKGRLVVQDRPEVVARIPADKGSVFEAMEHDFFNQQPVIGARAYHLHSIMHDWDDATCVKILQQLVPALRRGHSRVLINEFAVPERGARHGATSMDLLMMVVLTVRERTEAQFAELARQAGLQLTKVWTFDSECESILELELLPEEKAGE